MELKKIRDLLTQCDLSELRQVAELVADMVCQAEQEFAQHQDEEGRKQRKEERFSSSMPGTLTRITDVRPGERKEYSVTIEDVSRSGMRLSVDTNFVPSRVVEVTFAGPGGKIKQCYMEVVRMRKMMNESGDWLEVGCRAVSTEDVRRLRVQEDRINKMRSKLRHGKGIMIMVVGPSTEEMNKLIGRIKAKYSQVRQLDSVSEALQSAAKLSAQLLILLEGTKLCEDSNLLSQITSGPAQLAILTVVDSEEQRFLLFKAGIDECLLKPSWEEFLFHGIERALLGHVVRKRVNDHELTARALIVSSYTTRINLVSFQLGEQGYTYRSACDIEEARKMATDPFDLVLADFEAESPEQFEAIRQVFDGLMVVALCDDISQGHQAIAHGASNYLCMPPNEEEMRMILEGLIAHIPLGSKSE